MPVRQPLHHSATPRRLPLCLLAAVFTVALIVPDTRAAPSTETVGEALCRLIESSARTHNVPVAFLTRLIWRESSFRAGVVSGAGAQGVAQFMPGTARERGLADPFDPEQAIPEAAELIGELKARFGNLGLAAAAYNGGPARVAGWLSSARELPAETRGYVFAVTGRSAADWAEARRNDKDFPQDDPADCDTVVASLRGSTGNDPAEAPLAPWGVQLAGNFSKERALRTFSRTSAKYAKALGDLQSMVIGTRLRSRGTRTFYRVRIPASSRNEANTLCGRIRSLGGSCIVLPS